MTKRSDVGLPQARAWAEENDSAYEHMLKMAMGEASHKRKFGVQWLLESVRSKDFLGRGGKRSVANNNMAAALGRLLIEEHPVLKPYLRLRKSKVDKAEDGS